MTLAKASFSGRLFSCPNVAFRQTHSTENAPRPGYDGLMYGETVFLINFAFDALLLGMTGRLWGRPPGRKRLLTASAFGALWATLALAGVPGLDTGPARLLLPLLLSVLCWPDSLHRLPALTGTLWGLALLALGGGLLLIRENRQLHGPAAALAGFAVMGLVSSWTLVPARMRPFRRTVLCRAGEVLFRARVDTGNLLTEPISGLPVMLAGEELARKLRRENPLAAMKMRLVPAETAAGHILLEAYPLGGAEIRQQGWQRLPRLYWAEDRRLAEKDQAVLPPVTEEKDDAGRIETALGPNRGPLDASGAALGLHRRQRHLAPPAFGRGGGRGAGSHGPGQPGRAG